MRPNIQERGGGRAGGQLLSLWRCIRLAVGGQHSPMEVAFQDVGEVALGGGAARRRGQGGGEESSRLEEWREGLGEAKRPQ